MRRIVLVLPATTRTRQSLPLLVLKKSELPAHPFRGELHPTFRATRDVENLLTHEVSRRSDRVEPVLQVHEFQPSSKRLKESQMTRVNFKISCAGA